jgi:predicted SAM-dependent methyltransferase
MIFKGWDNCDINVVEDRIESNDDESVTQLFHLDIREPQPTRVDFYDYIFANHSLSYLTYYELSGALANIHSMLTEGGVLHILVPDAFKAIWAYLEGNADWFPVDLPTIDDRFCAYMMWYGESRSIFTAAHLLDFGVRAGFSNVQEVAWGQDEHDDRQHESIVAEFTK